MSGWWRPVPPVTPDELTQLRRREAFRQDHPDAQFGRAGGFVMAHVPYGNRSYTIGAESLRDVLDALEEFFTPFAGDG